MQALEQNGYTRQQVLDALRGTTGSRYLSFRYERLSSTNAKLGDLDGVVQSCTIEQNAFADIRRTAKLVVDSDTQFAWQSDRIKPWARLKMPSVSGGYDGQWTSADQTQTAWAEPFTEVANGPVPAPWAAAGNAYLDGSRLVLPATSAPSSASRTLNMPGLRGDYDDWYVEFAFDLADPGNGGRYLRIDLNASPTGFYPGHFVRVQLNPTTGGTTQSLNLKTFGFGGTLTDQGTVSFSGATRIRIGVDQNQLFVDTYFPASGRWRNWFFTSLALVTGALSVNSDPVTMVLSSSYTGTETEDGLCGVRDVSLVELGAGLLRLKLDGPLPLDSTPRLNDFSANNAVAPGARGIVSGSSYNFTAAGSGYLGSNAQLLNGLESLTVVGWYEHTSGINADAEIFSGFGSGGGQVVELKLINTSATSTFFGRVLMLLGDGSGYVNCTVTGTSNLQTPGPHCLAMTWQSGVGMTIYLDGEPIPVGSAVGQTQVGAIYSADLLRVGSGSPVFPAFFDGRIDDVSVYGRVLDPAAVRRLYRSGLQLGEYGSANYVEWPQGVFLPSSPTRKVDAGGAVTREVDAYDQIIVYADDLVSTRYSVAAAANYVTTVTTLLGSVDKLVVASAKTLPAAMEWEPGTSKLRIINDLLAAVNYQSLTFDEAGRAVIKPYQAPSERPPEYAYLDDETSVMDPEAESTFDLFSVPNQWVLVVSNPDKPALTSTYTNASPTSLTSTVTRGRTITDFRQEQDAADQATLDAKVARLAFEASQVYESVDFTTAVMPIHGDLDVYNIGYELLVVGGKYSESSWSMPLEAGAQMRHTARRVVTV